MSSSDAALLKRWIEKRDAEAFDEIVTRYADMVYATCKRILGNPPDAEEVAQECFLRLVEGDPGVRSSLGGWLHKLAMHRSLDRVRSERRREDRERRFAREREFYQEPNWKDVQDLVDEAIAALPDKLRDAVICHFLERQTHEAIASTQGVSRAAVTQRIGKGVEQIRKSLRKRGVSVSTSALAAMLAANTADAAPASLTSALAKFAIAGVKGPLAAETAAAGALTASKLVAIGGTTITWQGTLLAVGALVIGLGSLYVLLSGDENAPMPAHEPLPESAIVAKDSHAEPESQGERQHNVELKDKHQERAGGPSEKRERLQGRLLAAMLKLMDALRGRVSGEQESSGRGGLQPYTSKDIPPDNGAHYFLLAAELFPEIDSDWLYDKWDEIKAKGWSDDPKLLELFDACRGSFDAIRAGLDVGDAQLPLYRGFEEPLPYLATFRNLARVMGMEAQMHAAEGDYAVAFDNYAMLLDFATESPRGGVIINGLVGYACTAIGTDLLVQAIEWGGASPQDYRFVIEHLQAVDTRTWSAWESVNTEIDSLNEWLNSGLGTPAKIQAALLEGMEDEDDIATFTSMSPEMFNQIFRDAMQTYREYADYFALPYYEAQGMSPPQIVSENPMVAALLPPLTKMLANQAWNQAQVRGAMTMAAIELYRTENNTYPASLGDLVPGHLSAIPEDPFTGDSLVYSRIEAGYLLYSPGADMQDDGGWVDNWRNDGADMVIHRDDSEQ